MRTSTMKQWTRGITFGKSNKPQVKNPAKWLAATSDNLIGSEAMPDNASLK